MRPLELGSTVVHRIVELERWGFVPEQLFPTITEEQRATARGLDARWVDPHSGELLLAVHSYLVRTRHHTILIDGCNGNHKPRPAFQTVDQLDTPYLARLAAAGVTAEDVDIVCCTHLHPDHVGWNTRLHDGRWIPTFPNARYLMGQLEFDDMREWYRNGPRAHPLDDDLARSFEDSVLPVLEHDQAVFVDDGHVIDAELGQGVVLERLPGHTRGHTGVRIVGGGRSALATGDAFHHAVQLTHPELPQGADVDPVASTRTRRRLFEQFSETGAIALPGHFPAPSAGRIVEQGGHWTFAFVDA